MKRASAKTDVRQNSDEAFLRGERRALLGKINRRIATISILQIERAEFEIVLGRVEARLSEFKKSKGGI